MNEYSKTVTQIISKPGNITQHEVRARAAILHATKLKDVDVTIWFCFDGEKIISRIKYTFKVCDV
jgi:hypothetical protein